MKKLNVAIIGQGRSGRDIHGAFFKSEFNENFNINNSYRICIAYKQHLYGNHT